VSDGGDEARARVEAALDDMRADYLRDLPAQVAQLGDAARRARPATSDAAALRRATAEAHRIHGTAGTLGLSAISEVAARVERALGPVAGDDAAWAEVDAALAELRALVGG